MKRVAFAMGLLLAVAPGASGQSVPNIMKPKQAAARAVAATNRAVEANSTLPADAPANEGRRPVPTGRAPPPTVPADRRPSQGPSAKAAGARSSARPSRTPQRPA
jgi:hypothetical protein